jgi:hypothetical protein
MRRSSMMVALLSLLAPLGIWDAARAQLPQGSQGAAAEPALAADEVVSKVTRSADPKAAFNALSAKDQAAFNSRMKSSSFTIDSETTAADEEASDAKAGRRCWKGEVRGRGKNSFGGTIYTYWVQGSWCATGNRVTAARFTRAD